MKNKRVPHPLITSPKKKEMSKVEALELLNIPMDRASDFAFIDGQYRRLIQKLTPRVNLNQSPLGIQVNKMLESIIQVHSIAKRQ